MPLTTTPSERIGLCTRMRRFLVRFIRPESFVHTRSSAGFTITTSGFKFSVHTGEYIASRTAKLRPPPWTRLNRRPDAMQRKHPNGRPSTKMSLEHEIAHLRGLDLKGLRSRWQSIFQRSAPAHLTRHLLFAVIAYRIQADRFGDLDHETRQVLDRTVAKEAGPVTS